ncbi:Gfo/Idh/MocA family protein [Saccharopolyspora shandongensis]|uniref:Gfo/Idh/MocA family protein n=1 Tax=Saccharopolyspora shandongensis TaxID=418495 RepID=UPI0033E02959
MSRRVAMVGLGGQARNDHLPGLDASQHAELVAVCDIDLAQATDAAETWHVPGYTDVARMLQQERPDFIIAAVPHHAGAAVITACAQAGVHVMKEKPFATNPTEAAELAALCASSGIELMVTLQRRFHPVYLAVAGMLDRIGSPYLLDARYTFHCPDPGAGWRGQAKLAGGGCLADMGYHLIDLLIWFVGVPDRVLASTSTAAVPGADYDAEDSAVVHLEYDSGLHGSMLVSRSTGPKTERLTITGPNGSVLVERGAAYLLGSSGDVLDSLVREPAWPASSTVGQIDHFCRVLDGTRPNLSGPVEHLAHAAFLAAAYTSSTTGIPAEPKEFFG